MDRIATDLPDGEARGAGARPGGAGVLAARARGRPRLRDRDRTSPPRWRWRPERLDGVTEQMLADPDHYSFSHQHHAYRARGEYVRYLRRMAEHVGRDRIHVVDSHEFFTQPGAGVRRGAGLPRPAAADRGGRGLPGVRAAQRAARGRRCPTQLRAELTEHYAPYDEQLAEWLGRTPSWLS